MHKEFSSVGHDNRIERFFRQFSQLVGIDVTIGYNFVQIHNNLFCQRWILVHQLVAQADTNVTGKFEISWQIRFFGRTEFQHRHAILEVETVMASQFFDSFIVHLGFHITFLDLPIFNGVEFFNLNKLWLWWHGGSCHHLGHRILTGSCFWNIFWRQKKVLIVRPNRRPFPRASPNPQAGCLTFEVRFGGHWRSLLGFFFLHFSDHGPNDEWGESTQ
mmetsp:Transcript_10392/g.30380  ORF Transcript_10392/g.30380 Transcript_10392/m.30380 type:complete len:217 (-) Transcript_10392:333-983(-)